MIGTHELIVAIAGRPLHIVVSSEFALSAISPAFEHLPKSAVPSGHETCLKLFEENGLWQATSQKEPARYRIKDKGFAFLQDDPPIAESYLFGVGIEVRAVRAALSAGDFRAHPASLSLAAWLGGRGNQVLHAGAVAYEGKAALILGPGGVGKSTTTLACATGGADYLGDDLIFVETAPRGDSSSVVAHCLFATAKLNADSAVELDAKNWPVLGVTPKAKTVFAIRNQVSIANSAKVVALISIGTEIAGSQVTRLRVSEAVACLAPAAASVTCRTGPPGDWLATIGALASRIPAYRMPVTWELGRVRATVREIIFDAANAAR